MRGLSPRRLGSTSQVSLPFKLLRVILAPARLTRPSFASAKLAARRYHPAKLFPQTPERPRRDFPVPRGHAPPPPAPSRKGNEKGRVAFLYGRGSIILYISFQRGIASPFETPVCSRPRLSMPLRGVRGGRSPASWEGVRGSALPRGGIQRGCEAPLLKNIIQQIPSLFSPFVV